MKASNKYCVIMAGGIGSRFWPLSTAKHPKQFLDILGTGRTMIQQTFDRVLNIIPTENIYVVTNIEYIKLCREQLPEIPPANIVGEPQMKNTAACNLYITKKISEKDPNAVLLVVPADHLILKETMFHEKVKLGFSMAESNDYLITLGIQPTRPDTGYGYIQFNDNSGEQISKVKNFTEKPELETAKKFLDSGDFLWNAGIFIWNVKSIQKSFEQFLPKMYKEFSDGKYNSQDEVFSINHIYQKIDKISIDNGILEKAKNVYVIPADLGWSDLGTWTSVYQNSDKDSHQNTINSTNVLSNNSKGNVVRIKNKNKAAIIDGLENYIIVDTEDSLLICPLSNDQFIKIYVENLERAEK